jgi:hydroxymethylbilane synthase
LRSLGGGCQFPIAAHATIDGDTLSLEGLVAKPSGEEILRDRLAGEPDQADLIGVQLAKQLLDRGAGELLNA